MSGNVWEWCWDKYDSSYYSISPSDNPLGSDSGYARIIRGGYWINGILGCRTAVRNRGNPDNSGGLGFRLSRTGE